MATEPWWFEMDIEEEAHEAEERLWEDLTSIVEPDEQETLEQKWEEKLTTSLVEIEKLLQTQQKVYTTSVVKIPA